MSEVLYRKYRPKDFDEVLGQENIVKTLKSQIELSNFSHAYIFSGSRGTGKTSIARIFAKELKVTANDIYEIDSASNTGVDNMRDLIDSISILPLESPYKIYIFDEVHMLSKSAFNALLKTLEEPPKHVIFILATTEPHKIPDTIISRCEFYNFKKPSIEILSKTIKNVSKKEGFSIDDDSATLISILGEGSFRDTLGNLQKVLSISKDKKISYEEVLSVTGAPKTELVNSFIENVLFSNLEKSLSILAEVLKQDIDISLFIRLVLEKLRAIMLSRFGQNDFLKDLFSDKDLEFIEKMAGDKNVKIDSKTIIVFLDALTAVPKSSIPHLPLELGLVEILSK